MAKLLTVDEQASIQLSEYFQHLAYAEEKESYMMVFGKFSSKKKLKNGYTVRVSIEEPRKKVSRG